MRYTWGLTAAAALMAFGSLAPASADEAYPKFSGEIAGEIGNELTFDSDDANAEQNELGLLVEPDLYLHFTENTFINAGLVLESVRDPGPQEDRVFQDHGIFVEVLTINFENDVFGVYGGKFGPNISVGYDKAAGIFGAGLAEDDLELSEFLGAGGHFVVGDAFGDMAVSASIFTQDRTFLSESFITNRGRTNLAAGGPGNTSGPESFAIALDGEDAPLADGFNYHIGFARLADEANNAELRFAVAGELFIQATDSLGIVPMVEYAHFRNGGGNDNDSRHYLITSLAFEWDNWNAALGYSGKIVNIDGGGNGDTYNDLSSLSLGYAFDNGIGLDVGYKFDRTDGVKTHAVGAIVSYAFDF